MNNQNKEEYISSYISKLLRKNFGKGPHNCHTTLTNNYLVTYIRGFSTPMEEVLLQQGQHKYVEQARSVIVNHLLDEIKGVVQVTIETEVEEYYHDWSFPNNTGVLIFVLEAEVGHKCEMEFNTERLESEVGRISLLVEKIPDKIITHPVSESICLVERMGILVPIEKALYKKGFKKELRITKNELEKSYFHRDGIFEGIFMREVKDIFIDWNFKLDKSLMAFILASK